MVAKFLVFTARRVLRIENDRSIYFFLEFIVKKDSPQWKEAIFERNMFLRVSSFSKRNYYH